MDRADGFADRSASAAQAPRVLHSEELFGEAEQVLLMHRGQTYCLRRTRLGKLILTK